MERADAPLGLESRQRAAAAGGCVAVYLRLQGRMLRSSGSAESSRRWSRPVTRPSSSAEAGSRGHGPGRPGAQPVGAECRGAPGRGSAERAGEVAARRPRPRPPGALRHLLMLLLPLVSIPDSR
ncbi:hypothetical protein FJT64_010592 [Amphibalanus amphitrite]|uniref:Uncharacterized protein n=1 Tax=Amphibalanus amphitrite TaxID=1232801 RepID=A0A6A4VIW4_AMPAM|nr:hypothetical protein FJT64_010592 [Amphibalanus amphitrite]